MLNRRLFFLFPDAEHARRAVAELRDAGVRPGAIHTVAMDLSRAAGLPDPRSPERADAEWSIERQAWRFNLWVFFAALAGLAVAAWSGSAWGVALALLVMAGTFALGAAFALRVPDAHLDEFREALAHGEILLLVDVPPARVREIEALVHRRHPEAAEAGVGWTPA
jgi:catechol 2,3-dioxygenase-like lactoylglutathione lyase family enzyme